jgi:3-hydroxyisobutyrate dehydrogenase
MDKVVKIGWIGTGVMGRHMANHLMNHGRQLLVYNRTPEKADPLVLIGAKFLSPVEIARQADYVFMMLGYPHDVEAMVFDHDHGILKHMKQGAVLVDHTTSSPGLAVKIADHAFKKGVNSIDAPVSGGDIGAKNGQLVVMVGGENKPVEACRPLMNAYSREIQHMGKPGAGQHTKAAN